jgi:hypothetical protein
MRLRSLDLGDVSVVGLASPLNRPAMHIEKAMRRDSGRQILVLIVSAGLLAGPAILAKTGSYDAGASNQRGLPWTVCFEKRGKS